MPLRRLSVGVLAGVSRSRVSRIPRQVICGGGLSVGCEVVHEAGWGVARSGAQLWTQLESGHSRVPGELWNLDGTLELQKLLSPSIPYSRDGDLSPRRA